MPTKTSERASHRTISRRAVCLGLGAAALSAKTATASTGDWPSRPVTVVVPFAPGGNTDMMARLSSQYLSSKLGQPFVIENKGGGGGALGAIAVSRARPDGYTLLFGSSTQVVNIPMLQKAVYSHRDFTPISIFGAGPYLLGIKSSLPVKTLHEFIAYVKANPGKLNYGTAGVGGNVHLNSALFLSRAGLDMALIPYKSGAPAMAGLGRNRNVFRQRVRADAAHRNQVREDPCDLHTRAHSATPQYPGGCGDISGLRHLVMERFPCTCRNAETDYRGHREAGHRRRAGQSDH